MRRAVSRMREEIDGLIGEELARLLGGPPGTLDPGDVGEIRDDPSAREAGVIREGPSPTTPRPPQGWPPSEEAVAPLPSRDRRERAGQGGGAEDTERRLDALALRLEGRLKRTRDRATIRPGSIEEGGRAEWPAVGQGTTPSGGA